jgi:hypothetical protein
LACPSCRAAWTWRQNDTCLSSKTKEVSQVCSQRSKKSAHTYAKCALLCHFVLKRSAHGTFVHLRYQNDPKVLMECSKTSLFQNKLVFEHSVHSSALSSLFGPIFSFFFFMSALFAMSTPSLCTLADIST